MYINFWYPMATTEELTDTPLKVRALGQDFVVFRGEDEVLHARLLSNIEPFFRIVFCGIELLDEFLVVFRPAEALQQFLKDQTRAIDMAGFD